MPPSSAKPTAPRKNPAPRGAAQKAAPRAAPAEIVDPIWLLKALALSLAAALLCAYLAACLLFYQGAWQLVLHPSRTVDRTPAALGLPFTPVRFAGYDTGQPHLTAWYVPARETSANGTATSPASGPAAGTAPSFAAGLTTGPATGAATVPATGPAPSLTTPPRYAELTVLYLHDGSGSLSDTPPALTLLHRAGLNVFAIDYRGFGLSDASLHPDADRMQQDAQAALDYLVNTRHIAAGSVIPMGAGLGASLAVRLALNHPELPAVILNQPDPDPGATAAAARPSRIVPVRLIFGDRFAIAAPLAKLATPKLLIAGLTSASASNLAAQLALFHRAPSPSYILTLPATDADAAMLDALRRFLDQYLPADHYVPAQQ